jgi:hypothetical protein
MNVKIRDIKPTAEVEFETEDGVAKFTVAFLGRDALALDYVNSDKLSARVRAALADAIVGWNLTREDGTAWECTAENKALLLPQLVAKRVTKAVLDADGRETFPEGTMLGLALFAFIQREESFLKN